MFETSKKRLKVIEGDLRLRFHNRFICKGVDISIYELLTGVWI